MQFTFRELQSILRNPRFWIGFFSVVVILTVAGPFGTRDDFSLPESLVYWSLTCLATFIAGFCTSMSAGMTMFRITNLEWFSRVMGGLVAGVPVAVLVYTINRFAFGVDMGSWQAFMRVVGYCAVISLAVSILYYLISMEFRISAAEIQQTPLGQTVPFLRRLPDHLGKNLVRISIQDHYVEAVTDRGKHLILMRFADAVEELAQMDGLQVHRSHWVNKMAVKQVHRSAGRTNLEMTDGEMIPVSRTYLSQVRQNFPV